MSMNPRFLTHVVENQPASLADYDAYATDRALQEAVRREGGAWGEERLKRMGRLAGGELMQLGAEANLYKPALRLFDRHGHRLDEVEFHPAYHCLMETGIANDLHALPWREPRAGAQVLRLTLYYLYAQAEQGTDCPLTMTHACVPTLRAQPDAAREWLPRVLSLRYDPRPLPAAQKLGVTVGMGMTEKQGGSDVRSNSTRAHAIGARGPGQAYELVGHKWFLSAPMCDAFLTLAQADGGLSCFLMPRFRPDGTRNALRIQRLKDKLGNCSNATCEAEFAGAHAVMIGEEGRGIATILEMVALTRLDCIVGSAAIMRQALVQAIHHARHRKAFGKRLVDQPLMQNVLADIALESEAALALLLRIGRAVDDSASNPAAAAFARIATPVGKYWICRRAPAVVNEAQECLGGAGYVEESILPRLYREAPVNSLWEGCGNIQCLDVLRALTKEPDARDALFAELDAARGGHPALDRAVTDIKRELDNRDGIELRLRTIVEQIALALQASILLRAGPADVAEAFCASRLDGRHGLALGTLPAQVPHARLIDRAWPRT
ncbi:isovaleryl-CoA dehydrogenase [Sinimarinibacterium sp. CAU 1509]|uniref:isovaleryl-CoA dehydrogenase n=1 Tax=Sinimarinibacterium sp. CAU 1509 TaxID=2562283 RepID=UPI0010AD6701|nr:isovaleryl-CoA dehydrogenase [Sinimarinibacterium sp. CAU 1509]TJY56221.1 isovaleryl-CoA dehydrogenase [Sinimarinibacterium sp. CAU 1509]